MSNAATVATQHVIVTKEYRRFAEFCEACRRDRYIGVCSGPLGAEELRFVLAHKWAELDLTFAPDDYTDAEALAAIARITGGNFRLVQRLFAQIARIMVINHLAHLTAEVVETARASLVIGAT